MSDNELEDSFAKELAEAMKTNCTLEVILLESNRIGDAGAEALAAGLQHAKRLNTINIDNNAISRTGALMMLKARLLNLKVKVISSAAKQSAVTESGDESADKK